MAATIIAGIKTRNSFTRTMIIKPIIIKTTSKGRFNEPNPILLRIEQITGRKIAKFML
jgi:hypothetical protein